VAADRMSGAPLTPCGGKHSLMEKAQEAEAEAEAAAAAAAVSSLSLSSDSEGGKAAASAADATAGAGAGDASDSSETNWVEMPLHHVRWILAQKPEMHPTPSIEDYELYRTHDPVQSTVFSQASIDAKRELFTELFVSLRESHDDFFEYQAWVREVFERNGRVMVPEEVLGPRDDLQEEIDAIWARSREEYLREHPELESDSDEEGEEEHVPEPGRNC